MGRYDTTFDLKKKNVGHCDLYFMVHCFCPIILKTSWYMNTILRDFELVWPDVWSKDNVDHCDLYFVIQWFCLISWKLQWLNIVHVLWDYESVWPDAWPQNICRSLWPVFQGPVILPYILKTVYVWTLYFVIMCQCNAAFALKQCRSHPRSLARAFTVRTHMKYGSRRRAWPKIRHLKN